MELLDAYAIAALLRDEPAAEVVETILRRGEAGIPAVNLAEVIDVVCRRFGVSPDAVHSALAELGPSLTVIPVDARIARRAGELRARHYVRSSCPVSLADCVLVASAGEGDAVATADEPVLTVAEREGVGTIPLPDSTGRLPRS